MTPEDQARIKELDDMTEEEVKATDEYRTYRMMVSATLAKVLELMNEGGMHLDSRIISACALIMFELTEEDKLEAINLMDTLVRPVLIRKGYLVENEDGTLSPNIDNITETVGNC